MLKDYHDYPSIHVYYAEIKRTAEDRVAWRWHRMMS